MSFTNGALQRDTRAQSHHRVLYMAAVHLLPLPASKISLVIQLTGAGLLLIRLVFVAKITEELSGASALARTATVLLTGFYSPLNNWALQGMEIGMLCVIVTASIWLTLRSLHSERMPLCVDRDATGVHPGRIWGRRARSAPPAPPARVDCASVAHHQRAA